MCGVVKFLSQILLFTGLSVHWNEKCCVQFLHRLLSEKLYFVRDAVIFVFVVDMLLNDFMSQIISFFFIKTKIPSKEEKQNFIELLFCQPLSLIHNWNNNCNATTLCEWISDRVLPTHFIKISIRDV